MDDALKVINILPVIGVMFDSCRFENILNSVENKFNSLSGFADGGLNLVFRIFTDSTTTLVTCLANDNLGCIGL